MGTRIIVSIGCEPGAKGCGGCERLDHRSAMTPWCLEFHSPLRLRGILNPVPIRCPACVSAEVDAAIIEQIRSGEKVNGGPAHSFVDHDGKMHVAPGYNARLVGLTDGDDKTKPAGGEGGR